MKQRQLLLLSGSLVLAAAFACSSSSTSGGTNDGGTNASSGSTGNSSGSTGTSSGSTGTSGAPSDSGTPSDSGSSGNDSGGSHDAGADGLTAEQQNCGQPGDTGNSKGVGKYCTGFAGCVGNGTATTCSTLGGQGNFCTLQCYNNPDASDPTECGENAMCVCDTQGCGCTPNYCLY